MGLCTASVGKHHHAVKNAWMLGAVGGFAAEFVIIRRGKEKLCARHADSPLICAFICLTVGNGRKKKKDKKLFFPTASRRAARRLLCDQGRPATTAEQSSGLEVVKEAKQSESGGISRRGNTLNELHVSLPFFVLGL